MIILIGIFVESGLVFELLLAHLLHRLDHFGFILEYLVESIELLLFFGQTFLEPPVVVVVDIADRCQLNQVSGETAK